MTSIWGPLGWLTLHSIAAIYPEHPSSADRQILATFMEDFRDCITCNTCKGHFTAMLNTYKSTHPEFMNSKNDFFLFVCRTHNTVNARLSKPMHTTMDACITALRSATSYTTTTGFRNAYINHIGKNWGQEQSGDGRIHLSQVKQMQKINNEYFNPRDNGGVFSDENLASIGRAANVMELVPEDGKLYKAGTNIPVMLNQYGRTNILSFSGGRMRVRNIPRQ
jgi:FAD-linked sulfhydryl oxidase